MKNTIFLSFLILTGCSLSSQERRRLAWESWKNLPVTNLEKHPYFKNLRVIKIKHGNSAQTWIYKDQTSFQTGAFCQGVGGCLGYPIYNCENAFSVQDGKILGFEQKGSCPDESTIEAKKK
jgi:hypothetical protein